MRGIKDRPCPGQILKRVFPVFALALLTALISIAFTVPAFAQATTVTIYPSSQDVHTNSTFTVYVKIEPATPFVGAQMDIGFDGNLIAANQIKKGELLSDSNMPLFNPGSIDNSAGSIIGSYAVILGGGSIGSPGTFISIDCTARDIEGSCPLELSNVILSDSMGQSLPVTVSSGEIFIHTQANDGQNANESSSDAGTARAAGGSGGGGGSGSGTSEDAENICLKEAKSLNVLSNTTVTYRFTQQENPVTSVTYYSLKNAGQITSTIEILNDTSLSVTCAPPGTVYKNVNIWVGKYGYDTEENIHGAMIGFKVPKVWLEKNGFDAGSVRIYRFSNGSWGELGTRVAGEEADFVLFEADTPGFSPFAITAFALATGSPQSNYNVFTHKTGIYETMEGSGLQNEAYAAGEDSDDAKTLGQNSALHLIASLLFVTAIDMFLRKE